MAGLFDTLALGSRSLQTYRKAIDTTGHNLANVNTPGYTRQRLIVETVTSAGDMGSTGAGAEATRIVALKNEFTQKQLQTESSLEGALDAREESLKQTLTALQETIDRTGGSTSTNGISQKLSDYFNALQNLSNNPGSIADRQVVLQKAQDLAQKFNQIDGRLAGLGASIDLRVGAEVEDANKLLGEIATLNGKIVGEEAGGASANDLRDSRQAKIEALARLVKLEAVDQPNGAMNIVVAGQSMVEGVDVVSNFEAFTADDGRFLVRQTGGAEALNLGGGSLAGLVSARDGELARVRAEINDFASILISETNAIHAEGFSLTGESGSPFFNGSHAGDIAVNAELLGNPARLQASGDAAAPGGNAKVLGMAQLATKGLAAFGGQTFGARHSQIVSKLAQNVSSAQTDLEDQQKMTAFVRSQRDAVSAVSLDEEMASLVMFQKAFQASAKLISMTDEMLATIIGM